MNIVVGVTTVPSRFSDLLPKTLKSIEAAGFKDPQLFVDGSIHGPRITEQFSVSKITCRTPPLKTSGTWMLALAELYIREPHSDLFILFQDDILCCRNLRAYLEQSIDLSADVYYNLYTSPRNQEFLEEKKLWQPSNQRGLGALGLVFTGRGVRTLLTSERLFNRAKSENAHKSVDGAIVTVMRDAGWKEYVHNPSLIQHTGFSSVMGNDYRTPRGSVSSSFVGENFDALELLTWRSTSC